MLKEALRPMDKSPKKKSSKQKRHVEKNGGKGTVMIKAEKRASIPNEKEWRESIR